MAVRRAGGLIRISTLNIMVDNSTRGRIMTSANTNPWYVGYQRNPRGFRAFQYCSTPTEQTHGDKYVYVVGPFYTERGAKWAEHYGLDNPHFRTVEDAERYADAADTDAPPINKCGYAETIEDIHADLIEVHVDMNSMERDLERLSNNLAAAEHRATHNRVRLDNHLNCLNNDIDRIIKTEERLDNQGILLDTSAGRLDRSMIREVAQNNRIIELERDVNALTRMLSKAMQK